MTKPAQQVPMPKEGAAISKWVNAIIPSVMSGLSVGKWAITIWGALWQIRSYPLSHNKINRATYFERGCEVHWIWRIRVISIWGFFDNTH